MVFKAMDSKRDEHVVVKILKPVRKPKINREIRILQAVKGAFIISSSGIGGERGDLRGEIFGELGIIGG